MHAPPGGPPRRGDVWLAAPDPSSIGYEQKGRRPVIIVSADAFNPGSPVVMAVPLTTRERGSPLHVGMRPPEAGLREQSWALTDQLRALDLARLRERWGSASDMTMRALEERLRAMLDL